MTEENRRTNAEAELAVAEEALDAAAKLVQFGLLRSAVSRAYYAAFHATRALLATRGLEPRSHRGARHLLSTHFVKTGELDLSTDRWVAHAEQDREDADYDTSAIFTAEVVAERIAQARGLIEAVRLRITAP